MVRLVSVLKRYSLAKMFILKADDHSIKSFSGSVRVILGAEGHECTFRIVNVTVGGQGELRRGAGELREEERGRATSGRSTEEK